MKRLEFFVCASILMSACSPSVNISGNPQLTPTVKTELSTDEAGEAAKKETDAAKGDPHKNKNSPDLFPDTAIDADLFGGAARVWNGSHILLWGSSYSSDHKEQSKGLIYDPKSKTSKPMSQVGQPSPRNINNAFWTGSQLLIWGGRSDISQYPSNQGENFKDGYLYDPSKDQWESITPAPDSLNLKSMFFRDEISAFNDDQLVALKIDNTAVSNDSAGAIYHLSTKEWTPIAMETFPIVAGSGTKIEFSKNKIIVFGNRVRKTDADKKLPKNMVVAIYDIQNPKSGWKTIQSDVAPSERELFAETETKNGFLVWGGESEDGHKRLNDGAFFNLVQETWTPIKTEGAPTARTEAELFAYPRGVIVWSGFNKDGFAEGSIYSFDQQAWVPIDPSVHGLYTNSSVFTGDSIIQFSPNKLRTLDLSHSL